MDGSMDARRSLSYSLVIHGGFFLIVFALMKVGPFPSLFSETKKQTTWIEVVPSKKTLTDEDLNRTIVESAKGHLTKDAAKDALLGERTQTVDEQRVVLTPKSGVDSKGAVARKSVPAPRTATRTPPANSIPTLSNLGVPINPANQNRIPEQNTAPKAEEEGSLQAQVGGDYVKGFKAGETTILNTKEYVFYGYFQRIRKSLDRAWDQSLRNQLDKYFRRGRQLAANNDYTTQLMVTLNDDGQIIRIQVVSQSGTQDLDDASVKAFNSAGPFPNPPKGLIDKQGQIKVRWDFVVKT